MDEAGWPEEATRWREEVVGRNVLDGRWTFQIVKEFDEVYYEPVRLMLRELEERLLHGRRHVYEAEMKESRRSHGRAGHDRRPPAAASADVETDPS